MYGSGDNDYFFIDVNLSGGNPFSNKSNVDDIHSFYVSGPDILSEDYLCFKASQLGLTEAAMTKMGWNKETLTVLGQKLTAYAMDIELTKSETFFKVDGISEYKTEFIEDNLPAFILDTSNGDLYFDQDGDKIVGDQVLVAHLIGTKGDDLSNMHANQILVFPNL
jgi:hypothetical protein